MKEWIKVYLPVYKWPVLCVPAFFASVVFVVATAPYAWLLIGIATGIGSAITFGVTLYTANAEALLLRRKAGPHSGLNYHKGLRKLKRERRELVRKQYMMKSSGFGNSYYLDVIEKEKEIAKHMGIDYVKPDYLPQSRY